jgi:hypothetical protein
VTRIVAPLRHQYASQASATAAESSSREAPTRRPASVEVIPDHQRLNAVPLSLVNVQVRSAVGRNILG